MKYSVVLVLFLSAGWCDWVPKPNPSPTPSISPSPTPTPSPTPPTPICVNGKENCDCYVQPPNHDWELMVCTPPQVCKDKVCIDPVPNPTPTPVPTPTPTPDPNDPCPPLDPTATIYMMNKPYGNGFDSTVRVRGDTNFCYLIHGVYANDCHLEGWPTRTACEVKLLHGCPTWYFSPNASDNNVYLCHDDQTALASCDHFGDPVHRDDPQTPWPIFEGEPKVCADQHDSFGPYAGFFTIAHGKAYVRACRPDGTQCGPWNFFNH